MEVHHLGAMVAMSGASRRHERIVINLSGMLYNALRGKPSEPNGGNLRVRVRQTNYLYPDVTVNCGEPEMLDDTYLDTILNPAVIFRDYFLNLPSTGIFGIKWRLYPADRLATQHYVIIHPKIPARVEVHTRAIRD